MIRKIITIIIVFFVGIKLNREINKELRPFLDEESKSKGFGYRLSYELSKIL